VRYGDLRPALSARRESVEQIARGIRLFAVGLCKKVLFANTAGELWQLFRTLTAQNRNPLGAWCGLLCFSLQIYYDFSGYSDMAVGLGRMFGFSLPKNFDYPYTATSVREFWHRWHITLSAWFREYVYIPLGGSRCGAGRVLFNLFVTWALTGLWHGAAWNFLLWGVYFFLLLALERFAWGDAMKRWPSILRHGYLLLAVGLGWLIFAFDGGGDGLGFRDGIVFFSTIWNLPEITNFSANIWFELIRNLPILTLMCVGSTPLAARLAERLCKRHPRGGEICLSVLAVFGILLSLASLTREGYNPFLYFRF
jgi:alginate O-acetyltransferase complex protein AlgI